MTLFAAALLGAATGCTSTPALPPKAAELNALGVEALEKGDLETADARFALALEYSPRFVEALTNRGLLELQRGNFTKARQLLARARRINPDIAQPHHGLGVLAERERRPDEASEYYREALRVDPGFAPARANLARLLFDAGLLEHAREEWKKLVEVDLDHPDGCAGLAETLIRLERVGEADAAVAQGLLRFPSQPQLSILKARLRLRHGEYDTAVRLLEPLAGANDDVAAAALGWIATAELARGRPRHAVGAAERAVQMAPGDPVATYALAMALAELEDPGARAWIERALVIAPGDAALERARVRITGR